MKATIVHVCETLGKGGLENTVRNLILNFNQDQFQQQVICRIEGGFVAEALRRATIPVQILDKRKFTPRLFRTALDRISFDPKTTIIHGHGFISVSSEMIYSKFLGAKGVVVHVQNIVQQLTLKQILKKTILDRVTNQFIAVSDDVASSLRRVKVSNITTIKNSADSSGWTFMARPKNQHLGFPSNAFVLGMVGRVVKRKGFDLFLDIITGIKDVYGVIVGDGEYYPEVKRIIDRRNLSSKIKCFDFQAKLQDYYQLLDALFLYSVREGLPLAILESQAVGVPCFGNEVGGIGEVVKDGYNGYLISNTLLSEINNRIQNIKNNRDTLRRNARATIEKEFSLTRQVETIERMYHAILGLPRG